MIDDYAPVRIGTGEILCDKNNDWRDYKLKAEAVSRAIVGDSKYWAGRSERMFMCGAVLEFLRSASGDMKLSKAAFCTDRMCPACQRRRSLTIFHQLKAVCKSVQEESQTRYLLLTLTVPNMGAGHLKGSISSMVKSFAKMMRRKELGVINGFFRALEVTYNSGRDDYHPHFHCLLAVSPGYFKRGYIPQQRWLELWQESTGDYSITQVDIRRVKPNRRRGTGAVEAAAAEVGKYATKPGDYLSKLAGDAGYKADSKPVMALAAALKGKRLIDYGGSLKRHHKTLDLDNVEQSDLVDTGEELSELDAVMTVIYRWQPGMKQYIN